MQTEWRRLDGLLVLYTRFPAQVEESDLHALTQGSFPLMEAAPGPFIRVLDAEGSSFALDSLRGVIAGIHHPAFRHPLRRALILIVTPGSTLTPEIARMIRERVSSAEIFSTLAEAEAFIRREGPRLTGMK